jgi:hypothetical protein
LGVRTLDLIAQRSPLENGERVKVGRKEVTRIARRALLAALSNRAVTKWATQQTLP